jgi:beta-glucosidase
MPKFDFPRNFIFGAATASYQVEGAVAEDGRGESIWDRFSHTPGKIKDGSTGDVACDHYHRAAQDIALMKDLGLQAYRFSIAWPRIIPDGDGAVNPKGLDWYSRLVDQLLAADIKPFATLFHWDLPQALEDKFGGWRSRKIPEAFGRYAETVVRRLGDRVKNWMTINEMPSMIVPAYGLGSCAPGAKEPRRLLSQIQHHVLLAHGYGVQAVRLHGRRGGEVGTAHNPLLFVPACETPEHIEAAAKAFRHYNGAMLESMTAGRYPEKWLAGMGTDAPEIAPGDMELISSPCDFIGLNAYSGNIVRSPASVPDRPSASALPAGAETANTDFFNVAAFYLAPPPSAADGFVEIPFPESYPPACGLKTKLVPQSLYWAIRHATELYGYKKVYIAENGCTALDKINDRGEVLDTDRVLYLRLHLQSAARALAEKFPLKGYFVWTFMDNFEWSFGLNRRLGLYYVDFQTQQRIRKFSAQYYATCIGARRVV